MLSGLVLHFYLCLNLFLSFISSFLSLSRSVTLTLSLRGIKSGTKVQEILEEDALDDPVVEKRDRLTLKDQTPTKGNRNSNNDKSNRPTISVKPKTSPPPKSSGKKCGARYILIALVVVALLSTFLVVIW